MCGPRIPQTRHLRAEFQASPTRQNAHITEPTTAHSRESGTAFGWSVRSPLRAVSQ
jgi:hypothetical protein